MDTTNAALRSDFRHMPKIDLHRHLEGSIRPGTVLELYRSNHGRYLNSTLEGLLPDIQFTGNERGLANFIPKFQAIVPCLKTSEDLTRITLEAIEDAERDGVVYLELRLSPHFIAEYTGLSPEVIAEAVITGKQRATSSLRIHVGLIFIVPQYAGVTVGEQTLELALAHRSEGASGLDLAGDVRRYGVGTYASVFRRASQEGLGVTVHAGEDPPAEAVRIAVEDLGAGRIGHGIRSVDDPGVLDLVRRENVLLELCVTGNLQTGRAPSLEEHPIRRLFEAGVRVSVNTDNPAISATTVSNEYALLAGRLGLGWDHLRRMNLDALSSAFASDTEKAVIRTAFA